jgi:hypothetical protein
VSRPLRARPAASGHATAALPEKSDELPSPHGIDPGEPRGMWKKGCPHGAAETTEATAPEATEAPAAAPPPRNGLGGGQGTDRTVDFFERCVR